MNLELRNKIRKKKPNFLRLDAHKKRLKKKWVKPRGVHHKAGKAGHPKKVSTGYGSPKSMKGLNKDGLKIKVVNNEIGLSKVNKETEGIVLARSIGSRNRIQLLKKAKELGIKVLNFKVEEYLKKREEEQKERLEKKKEKEKKKAQKKDKEEKKDKLEEKLSDEEKKDAAKKEKDKLLTKREV